MTKRRALVLLVFAVLALVARPTSAHENDCDIFVFSGQAAGPSLNPGAFSECHDDGSVDPDYRYFAPFATHASVGTTLEGPKDAAGEPAPITATVTLDDEVTADHEMKWDATRGRYITKPFALEGADKLSVTITDAKGEVHSTTYTRRL